MKKKFIEWFIKNNNGCSPAMEDDRSFVHEKTQHMFEAYQAGVAEGEARCAALAAENAGLKSIQEWAVADVFKTGAKRFESTKAAGFDTDDCLHDAVLVMLSELQTPATDAFLAEVRASALDKFARAQDEQAKKYYEMSPGCSAQDECQFAASQAWYFAECIRKGVQS
ncbi:MULTISPECIES: hypothetical protein [Enterobacteriaceae]|uniref:hypothetical protein n=1 Tax=Enterobacteriaceae TaxID=543 RepID=UPI00158504CF|nr:MULTISPECIES: hypothetical protein [Enterobacteriaceae]ELA3567174.1 hypothetical protein [Escherichia coli]MCN3068668.1 hypothetical protein [Escherichia coli]HCT7020133.1 hypothetical protein [Escherichia coli]HCT8795256.1 hypothetical protein [Escherichia coli]HDK0227952.1 hypothetical protein [Escherichia coli]